jgi:hypothetical protein
MHYIGVKFKQGSFWSRVYTYIHDAPLQPGCIVLVPDSNGFYSVGQVSGTLSNYKPVQGIEYKQIAHVI